MKRETRIWEIKLERRNSTKMVMIFNIMFSIEVDAVEAVVDVDVASIETMKAEVDINTTVITTTTAESGEEMEITTAVPVRVSQ